MVGDVAPVELIEQHGDDQHDLDDGRHELQDHHADDGLDAVAAALQHPRQAAGLALEMKPQRQKVHVAEGDDGEPPHRVHRHLGEDPVAHLGEERHQDAGAAIGDRHRQRRGEHPDEPGRARSRRARLAGQRVDRPLEGERNGDGGELRQQQEEHRQEHAQLEVAAIGRPDIGPQADQRGEELAAVGRDVALIVFGRSNVGIAHWFVRAPTNQGNRPSPLHPI